MFMRAWESRKRGSTCHTKATGADMHTRIVRTHDTNIRARSHVPSTRGLCHMYPILSAPTLHDSTGETLVPNPER